MPPLKPHHHECTVLRLRPDSSLSLGATSSSTQPLSLLGPIKLWCVENSDTFVSYDGTIVHVHGYSLINHGHPLSGLEWPKLYPLNVFVFHVSGIRDHQQAADAHAFVAGNVLLLERDPASSAGPNEIRVMSQDGGLQAGFVPTDVAAMMAPIMDSAHLPQAAGAVLKTFFMVEGHRKAIEVVAVIGRELDLVL